MDRALLVIERARYEHLAAIIELYQGDAPFFAAGPEPGLSDGALSAAFDSIQADANNGVYVAVLAGMVLGTFQLTFVRQLSYGGALVAQLESVMVHEAHRSLGIGAAMVRWAIDAARERHCLRIQLTTHVRRTRAHGFYESLGFSASHRGMKLYLK